MDKFEEFLNKKIEEETKEFFVPESFNLKIEETLESLPNKRSNNKKYLNKKILGSVACFTFICLIGIGVLFNEDRTAPQMAMDRSANIEESIPQAYNMEQAKTVEEVERVILNINEIQSLNFKSLEGEAKYKFVNNLDDVEKIVAELNLLNIEEIEAQEIKEWDFLIQTNGSVNHSIMIKDKYININKKSYQSNCDISEIMKEIYSNMNYEEKAVKYCDVN